MATSDSEARYYIEVRGIEDGPFRLRELLEEGVERDTPVWVKGSADRRPAQDVPEVAALLDEQWQRQRKAARKAERLPDPEVFGKLRLLFLCANIATGVFFVIASTALLTSLVLLFTAERAARIAMLVGIVPMILAVPLLAVEAGLLGAFLWNCLRVAKVLAPGRDQSREVDWRDWMQLTLDDAGVTSEDADEQRMRGVASRIIVFALPAFVVFCVVGIALSPIMIVFLALYSPFGIVIYRLGYRLDIAVDRYRLHRHGVPWAPTGLGFATAVAGLFLLIGPLGAPFFVLLPIWVHRTAAVAEAICRTDPARFVKNKPPPELPAEPPASPFDVPTESKTGAARDA
jgi:hypothetical protein